MTFYESYNLLFRSLLSLKASFSFKSLVSLSRCTKSIIFEMIYFLIHNAIQKIWN